MSRKDKHRVELDDRKLPSDRRISQVKGDIDVADMDSEDLANLRDEDLNNLNPDELDRLEAETGVTRHTEDETDIVPERALHKDIGEVRVPGQGQVEKAPAAPRPERKR